MESYANSTVLWICESIVHFVIELETEYKLHTMGTILTIRGIQGVPLAALVAIFFKMATAGLFI